MRIRVRLIGALAVVSACAGSLSAQVCIDRTYHTVSSGMTVIVSAPCAGGLLALRSCEGGEALAEARVATGAIDLLTAFPDLPALVGRSTKRIQLECGGVEVGPPLVIEPLVPSARALDGWTARVVRAMDSGDRSAIEALLKLPPRARETLRAEVVVDDSPDDPPAAWRVYEDRWVLLETTQGNVSIVLRPDAAPRSAWHFRSLVEDGFYDGTPLRSVREQGAASAAFVQGGDPSDEAPAGTGITVAYERSELDASAGTIALVRLVGEPDSASTAFVITLSDSMKPEIEACCTPIGTVVHGESALRAFSRRDAGAAAILRASLIPAPSAGVERAAVSIEPATPPSKPDR